MLDPQFAAFLEDLRDEALSAVIYAAVALVEADEEDDLDATHIVVLREAIDACRGAFAAAEVEETVGVFKDELEEIR